MISLSDTIQEKVKKFNQFTFNKQKEWLLGFYEEMKKKVKGQSNENFYIRNFQSVIDKISQSTGTGTDVNALVRLYTKVIISQQKSLEKKRILGLEQIKISQKRLQRLQAQNYQDIDALDDDLMASIGDIS